MTVCAAGVVPLASAGGAIRWQPEEAGRALATARFRDDRIVGEVRCLATGGTSTAGATRCECAVAAWKRPAAVTRAQWRQLTAALRAGDQALMQRVLGLRPAPTGVEREAVLRKWGLDRPAREVVGVRVTSPANWSLAPARLDLVTFDRSLKLASDVRNAVPAIEAYGIDHDGYAGMSLARLKQLDGGLSSRLEIVSADERGYCVQVSAEIVSWSVRGPGGRVVASRC